MLYKEESAFAEAEKVIPGGVNSPVRAFKAVGELQFCTTCQRRLFVR
jgi:glutamate-1-semialdehyde aminotransferase